VLTREVQTDNGKGSATSSVCFVGGGESRGGLLTSRCVWEKGACCCASNNTVTIRGGAAKAEVDSSQSKGGEGGGGALRGG
jgi:hypothetical protein